MKAQYRRDDNHQVVSFWRWREIRGSLESLAQAPTSPHFPLFCSKEQQSGDERTQLLKQTSGPHRGRSAHPATQLQPTSTSSPTYLSLNAGRFPPILVLTSQQVKLQKYLNSLLKTLRTHLKAPHNLRTHPSPVALVRRLMVAAVYSSGLRWYRHQRAPHCLLPR